MPRADRSKSQRNRGGNTPEIGGAAGIISGAQRIAMMVWLLWLLGHTHFLPKTAHYDESLEFTRTTDITFLLYFCSNQSAFRATFSIESVR